MDDVQRAVKFLAENGYRVTGVTFDLFQSDGLSGVGLLSNGHEVRFFIPDVPDQLAVIGSPRPSRL